MNDNIHVLHAGEGNMKMYSPKSIIFPEGKPKNIKLIFVASPLSTQH